MSRATRNALNHLEMGSNTPNDASYRFLIIVRSAMDMRLTQSFRIRQGLLMLLQAVLKITSVDVVEVLKNTGMLLRFGILRSSENPAQIVSIFTSYLKFLDHPASGLGQRQQTTMNLIADQSIKSFQDRIEAHLRKRLKQKRCGAIW